MRRPFIHHLSGFLLLCLLHTQCTSGPPSSRPHPSGIPRSPSSTGKNDNSKFKYVCNSHLKKVLQELEGGNKQNIDSKDKDGNAAIHLAFKNHSSIEILEFLLQHKANVEAVDDEGNTAIHLAVRHHKSTEILKLLLQHKANVEAVDGQGNTALMLAANIIFENEQEQALDMLLQHNANRNIQNKKGDTALMMGLSKGDYLEATFAMVQKLANDQTDFMLKDNAGNHPLHLAMKIGDAEQRKQAWQHILAMMQQTLANKNMTKAELETLLLNKAQESPHAILLKQQSCDNDELIAYVAAYSNLLKALGLETP